LNGTGVEIHFADVGDHIALRGALRGVDIVLNCAARTGPWGPESEYEHTNVRGLETLVHVSSITVHGNDVHGTSDENAPLREEPNPYSRSKVAGERLLQRLIHEERAPVTIVRPGWIYGPRDTASFARIARMIESGRMRMIGSGQNHLPLVYVRDVARGMLLAGQAAQARGRAYLLVNDQRVTQRDFIAAIAAELGAPMPARQIPYELAVRVGAVAENLGRFARRRQPPPVMRYGMQLLGGDNCFIISRARRELGFAPLVDLEDGVRRSVKWYRATYGDADGSQVAA
jgi:nucleoside-diphosphate-sugar epimerase